MSSTGNTTFGGEESNVPVPPVGYGALCIANLLLCSIASVLCIILIFATTVPLFYPKLRKRYSTYNLYLTYIAIPDLISNSFIVYMVLSHGQWKNVNNFDVNDDSLQSKGDWVWMFDHPMDHSVHTFFATSNLYTNAFLTHEIFRLLQNSHVRRRHRPPTIAKVTKQAMVSYGLGTFIFLLEYFISGILEKRLVWFIVYQCLSFLYSVVIPFSVMAGLSYRIFKQELLTSTQSMYEGRLKILVVYFARIVLTDLLLWVPASVAYMLYWLTGSIRPSKILAYNVSMLFTATQSIVNFGCSLAKPDTRELIVDLVLRCRYLRKGSCANQSGVSSRRSGGTFGPSKTSSLESHGDNAGSTAELTAGEGDPYLLSLSLDGPATASLCSVVPPGTSPSPTKKTNHHPRSEEPETSHIGVVTINPV